VHRRVWWSRWVGCARCVCGERWPCRAWWRTSLQTRDLSWERTAIERQRLRLREELGYLEPDPMAAALRCVHDHPDQATSSDSAMSPTVEHLGVCAGVAGPGAWRGPAAGAGETPGPRAGSGELLGRPRRGECV